MADPTTTLPPWWAERLGLLLDALGDVALTLTPAERASLAVVARQELETVINVAAVMGRARARGQALCHCGHSHGFGACPDDRCSCLGWREPIDWDLR